MLGTWALMFSLFGCQASLNAEANVNGSAEASGEAEMSDFDKPLPSATAPTLNADSSRVLLGARHDLTLEPGSGTASCQCLAVGLGGARATGMRWSAGPPALDDTTQLAIALSSDGADCRTSLREASALRIGVTASRATTLSCWWKPPAVVVQSLAARSSQGP